MKIEFEITLRCNAECPSCSRHCHYGMYGYDSDVTMGQVERFIEEVKRNPDIDIIHIMGGEPILHPELGKIMFLFQKLQEEGFIKRCQLVTNGKLPIPIAFEHRKLDVCVLIASPKDKADNHRCMLVAPCDTGQELKDCPVPYDCGISFGAYGFWPCGAGGAIARLFGLTQYNLRHFPSCEDEFPDRTEMCVLCQAKAKQYMWCRDFGEIRSVSFRKAFREFDAKNLRRY